MKSKPTLPLAVNAVIEDLGGTANAAKFFDVTPGAISQWKAKQRIPPTQARYLYAMRSDLVRKHRIDD